MGQDPNERQVQPPNEIQDQIPSPNSAPPSPYIPRPVVPSSAPDSPQSVLVNDDNKQTGTVLENNGTNDGNIGTQAGSSGQNMVIQEPEGVLNLQGGEVDGIAAGYTVDAIMQQQNEIHAETSSKQPLIGRIEEIMSLKVEYEDDSTFLPKIEEVAEVYSRFRRMRGDGSCFYRGFLFSYLENLVNSRNTEERDRMIENMRQVRKAMSQHCQDFIIEEFSEPFMDLLQLVGKYGGTMHDGTLNDALNLQGLVSYMQDETNSNQLIFFMRLLTSHAIKVRQDHFAPFILANYEDCATVEEFCQRYVEPIHEESDEYQIVALTGALKVPVRVVYVDSRQRELGGSNSFGGKSGISTHDFIPEDCSEDITPKLHLLYRPGHYDVLYQR